MWFLDKDFLNNIRQLWNKEDFEGSRMFDFISKLKSIREKISKME